MSATSTPPATVSLQPAPGPRGGLRSRASGRVPTMPGLDGIRALAVAAVFAYHAEVRWLPGGFLGVDVFFVLSGYLITSLLLAERERTGTISLRDFWIRRARRLGPALLIVVVSTLVLASIFAPGQLANLRWQALAAVFYVANWHDILVHGSYFTQFGRPPLMRQLWSLSVEEQFYLAWPVILLIALRRRVNPRRVGQIACAIAVVSATEMVLLAGAASQTRLYEGTDTRAATLLVGALAAVLCPPGRLRRLAARIPPAAFDLAGVVGLIGLVWLMSDVSDSSASLFRGPLLLASLLAGMLVVGVAQPAAMLGRVFARRPLRFIGERSYGIYLWHWPVIALTRSPDAGYGESASLIALQAAITLALASAMYALVERPIRRDGLRATLARLHPRRGALTLADRAVPVAAAVAAAAAVLGVALGGFAPALGARPTASTRPAAIADRHAPPRARGGHATHQHLPTLADATRLPSVPRDALTRRPGATGPVVPAPRGPVMVFGDSVVLGVEPALRAALGPHTTFNASIGRQPQNTVAAIAAAAHAGTLPQRVVVSLGDNGLVTAAMLHQLRDVLASTHEVVLVTPRVPEPWGPPSATAIRAAQAWWPGVRIADWSALSTPRNGWFNDGVHPDVTGIQEFVALVVATLRARGAP